jgi:hypothetical protein
LTRNVLRFFISSYDQNCPICFRGFSWIFVASFFLFKALIALLMVEI